MTCRLHRVVNSDTDVAIEPLSRAQRDEILRRVSPHPADIPDEDSLLAAARAQRLQDRAAALEATVELVCIIAGVGAVLWALGVFR